MAFQNLKWETEKVTLENISFALQVHLKDDKRNETTGFVFYKDKKLIDMYEAFFKSEHYPKIERMLEIGMWDGGSAVFWHKLLQPSTLIGVDLMKSRKGTAFESYKKTTPGKFS